MVSKSQSLLNSVFIMPCETQHTYTCHNQRQLLYVTKAYINITIIVSSI